MTTNNNPINSEPSKKTIKSRDLIELYNLKITEIESKKQALAIKLSKQVNDTQKKSLKINTKLLTIQNQIKDAESKQTEIIQEINQQIATNDTAIQVTTNQIENSINRFAQITNKNKQYKEEISKFQEKKKSSIKEEEFNNMRKEYECKIKQLNDNIQVLKSKCPGDVPQSSPISDGFICQSLYNISIDDNSSMYIPLFERQVELLKEQINSHDSKHKTDDKGNKNKKKKVLEEEELYKLNKLEKSFISTLSNMSHTILLKQNKIRYLV